MHLIFKINYQHRNDRTARTGMADSGVIYFYPHFVCLGRFDFDIFDSKVLPRVPGDGSLAVMSLVGVFIKWLQSTYFATYRLQRG